MNEAIGMTDDVINTDIIDGYMDSVTLDDENSDEGFEIVRKKERKPKPSKSVNETKNGYKHGNSSRANKNIPHLSIAQRSVRPQSDAKRTNPVHQDRLSAKAAPTATTSVSRIPNISASKDISNGTKAPLSLEISSNPVIDESKTPTSINIADFAELIEISENSSNSHDYRSLPTSERIIPRGLVNQGNACYRNVIYQAFLANHQFFRFLQQLTRSTTDYQIPDELGVFKELTEFTRYIYLNRRTSDRSQTLKIGPDTIFVESVRGFKALRDNEGVASSNSGALKPSAADSIRKTTSESQEDAMEYFTYLLDKYHEILTVHGVRVGVDRLDVAVENICSSTGNEDEWKTAGKGVNMSRATVDTISKKQALEQNNSSIVSRLFHGIMRSEVVYHAKKSSSTTFQRFHFIPIDLRQNINRSAKSSRATPSTAFKVGDCLDRYFSSSFIDGEKIEQTFSIDHLPPILVLQVERFAFDAHRRIPIKVEQEIEYSSQLFIRKEYLSLNLQDQLFGTSIKASDTSELIPYRLVAVILHHGCHAVKGHYTTFIMDAADQWRYCDDDKIEYVNEANVLASRREVSPNYYSSMSRPLVGTNDYSAVGIYSGIFEIVI